MFDKVQPIDVTRPPSGWHVATSLAELAAVRSPSIVAATYLPRDHQLALAFCDAIESITLPVHKKNQQRSICDLGSYSLQEGSARHYPARAAQPCWSGPQAEVLEEFTQVGAQLADSYVAGGSHYILSQISAWHDFRQTAPLHRDNIRDAPIDLVHQLCLRPTIVQIDGQLWQGPPGAHNLFKASLIPHCADRSQPERPHVQATNDVIRIVERMLD